MDSPRNQRDVDLVNKGLSPDLGLFTTTMLVLGCVVGSGIFRKPGIMAEQVGSPELLLAVWVLAGVFTLLGALTNAEIAAMIPATGGPTVFYERMYGPFFGYLYGWAAFAVIQSGSIAAVSYVFAEYATEFVTLPELHGPAGSFSFHVPFVGDVTPLKEIGVKGLAALLITVLTAINYAGVRFGGVVQNIFTVAKVAGIGLLVIGAFLLPTGGSAANLTTASATIRPEGLALVAAIAAAMQGAFWAYDGWSNVTFVAGEVKQPQRDLPRSLVLGIAAAIAIYVIVNVAYTWVLPIDAMAQSKLVAADVAEKCFRGGGRWIALVVMVSTFGAANAMILSSSRIYFSMARRSTFPGFLGVAHPRFHTPAASLLAQGVWSVLLLLSGTFDTLTDALIFVSWVFYGASAYGVFVLRRKEPDTPRPYRVPGYPWIPWVFVLFSALFLTLTIYSDVSNYLAVTATGRPAIISSALGVSLVLIGAPIYLFYRAKA